MECPVCLFILLKINCNYLLILYFNVFNLLHLDSFFRSEFIFQSDRCHLRLVEVLIVGVVSLVLIYPLADTHCIE